LNRNKNILARIDWITILLYLTLIIIGWINIYAAVYNTKHQSILDFSQKYGKQLIWIFAGIILIIIIFIIKARVYKFFAYPIYVITILLLIFVLLFGREVNGARSWFEIGNFRLQPAEFAKFATSLALAKFLSSFNFNI
jgi:rod shape determining protein RodA